MEDYFKGLTEDDEAVKSLGRATIEDVKAHLITKTEPLERNTQEMTEKEQKALDLIEQYGGIDGAHHKDWVLDQVARILLGEGYEAWVVDLKSGEDGPETYGYDEGIAP